VHWDGLFYWSPPLRRGLLHICRPESPDGRQTVKLKGLQPDGKYWLWCEDGSIEPGVRSGKELMDRGLAVCLPQPYTSDLIFFQDEALGKPRGLEPPGEFRLKPPEIKAGPFSVSATLPWVPSTGANSYRVTVSDRADFGHVVAQSIAAGPCTTLDNLPPDRQLHWRVEAISWGGSRAHSGPTGILLTPRLARLAGIVFLSDMPWTKATAGADNPVRRNKNYYGKPISIAGKTYPKGLWTHAFPDATPADTVFDLSGKRFAAFRADVGLDDASGGGSVQFQVWVDGQLKSESLVLRPREVHHFHIDLAGAKQLTLRVLNGGDGHACDHAVWGFARLIAADAADPLQESR
jgi:hypothetical protein